MLDCYVLFYWAGKEFPYLCSYVENLLFIMQKEDYDCQNYELRFSFTLLSILRIYVNLPCC